MKRLPIAARRVLNATLTWLAVPFNAVLALLGTSLLVSLLSLALADRLSGAVLYFPGKGGAGRVLALRGEYRELPKVWGAEARAGLVADELLLGPLEPENLPAFTPGIRAGSVIVRKRVAWIDLSEEAALAPRESLERGIAALERSLRASLPLLSRVVVTIGGREPWADWSTPAADGVGDGSAAAKIEEKN